MTSVAGRPSGALDPRQRVDQHVDALEVAQLADEDEIGRIGVGRTGIEFVRRQAVMDHRAGAGAAAPIMPV